MTCGSVTLLLYAALLRYELIDGSELTEIELAIPLYSESSSSSVNVTVELCLSYYEPT